MPIQPNFHLLSVVRVKDRMDERPGYVCLDRNERLTPFSQEVFKEMMALFRPELFCYYPDPSPIYQRLSRNLNLPEECIYVTPGSDAAIRMVFQSFVKPFDTVLLPDPTYAMYPIYAEIHEARVKTVEYDRDRKLSVDLLLELLREGPRLLAIANPGQPTGSVLRPEEIRSLAWEARNAGTLLLVDEAYHPFCPETAIGLVPEMENVAVLRSFSKVGGMAGLRLGYLAAHPRIIDGVQRVRGLHEVNSVAIAIGSYILDHPQLMVDYVKVVEEGRDVLRVAAEEMGFDLLSCPANFQLLRFPDVGDTGWIVEALKAKGYLVRGQFSSPALLGCIRVTLGGPEIMKGFAAALREVMAERGRPVASR